jgi:hypothetical protein
MIKYSKLDSNNKVVEVVDVDENISDVEKYLTDTYGQFTFIKTDLYTAANIHYGTDFKPDGGIALRKNFGAVGFSYDSSKDAFIPNKPFESWILDEQTCNWNPPVSYPQDKKIYKWNESNVNWEEIV